MTFNPLPDHELQKLADEQLIAYVRAARDVGELAARPPRPDVPRLRLRARRQAAPLDPSSRARRRRPRPRRARQGDRSGVRRQLGRRVPQLAAHDRRPHRSRLLPARGATPEGDDPAERARRRGGRLGRRAARSKARPARSSCASSSRRCSRRFQRETQARDRAARLRRADRGRGLRQDRGDERRQRRPDRLAIPRQAPRPGSTRLRRSTG